MTNINDRLQIIVNDIFGGNKAKFAKAIEIAPTSISNYLSDKRKSKPSADMLEKIINVVDGLSAEWLLTGKGPMLKTEHVMPEINYEHKGAPYYNVDFTGGFDLVSNDQTTNPDYYIDYQPYNKPGVLWCNVTGHSMEPEINHGDTIAIKELSDWRVYLPFGEIYGIVTSEHRTIKRITKAEKEGCIKLVPTNKSPEYSPQEIPIAIIQKIFLVLGNVKRFQ